MNNIYSMCVKGFDLWVKDKGVRPLNVYLRPCIRALTRLLRRSDGVMHTVLVDDNYSVHVKLAGLGYTAYLTTRGTTKEYESLLSIAILTNNEALRLFDYVLRKSLLKHRSSNEEDVTYIGMVRVLSLASKAIRGGEACIIVKDKQIISSGVNGTVEGLVNDCEFLKDGAAVTKPGVLHAELNALSKLAKNGNGSAKGATLYCLTSPCAQLCAPLIVASGIKRVVYTRKYRDTSGLDILHNAGIETQEIKYVISS